MLVQEKTENVAELVEKLNFAEKVERSLGGGGSLLLFACFPQRAFHVGGEFRRRAPDQLDKSIRQILHEFKSIPFP